MGRVLESSNSSSSPSAPTLARCGAPRCRNCGVCWRGSRPPSRGATRSAGSRPILSCSLHDVDELVGLAAQFVGNHRRLRRHGGDDGDAHAAPLHRLDQRTEIAVAGKQHHVVDRAGELHGIDGKLDIHVAFDLAAAGLIDEFLGRLGHDRVAVIVEPIDQRPDRRIFLILDNRGVIERAQQIAARLKFLAAAACSRCRSPSDLAVA